MKKYIVGFLTADNDQYEGREPQSDIYDFDSVQDYVEADSEWEAIDFALDRLVEDLNDAKATFDIDREKQEIKVFDENKKVSAYCYNFKAEVQEDY